MAALPYISFSTSVDQYARLSREREPSDMNDYTFEVRLRAVVHVRAPNEEIAGKVVSSVLGAPGSVEIRLANENNGACGNPSIVTDVEFVQECAPKLVKQAVRRNAA
jgi:hypothetical protein